jgi:hypothetical protein
VTTKTATLSFGVTDANASGATPVCRLDGTTVPCTTATTLVLSNLGDGAHVVAVTATDKAGNAATQGAALHGQDRDEHARRRRRW